MSCGRSGRPSPCSREGANGQLRWKATGIRRANLPNGLCHAVRAAIARSRCACARRRCADTKRRSLVIASIQPIGLRHLIVACAASLSLACSSSSPAPAGTGPVDAAGESDATTTTRPWTPGRRSPTRGRLRRPTRARAPVRPDRPRSAARAIAPPSCRRAPDRTPSTGARMTACTPAPTSLWAWRATLPATRSDAARRTRCLRRPPRTRTAGTRAPTGTARAATSARGSVRSRPRGARPRAASTGAPRPTRATARVSRRAPGTSRSTAADGGVGLDGGYNAQGPAGGNTLDCREYHLGASLAGGAMQQLHCQHPGVNSATCM